MPTTQRVKWARFDQSRVTGDSLPSGYECYVCFDTMRRFFKDDQNDLVVLRAEDGELDKKW